MSERKTPAEGNRQLRSGLLPAIPYPQAGGFTPGFGVEGSDSDQNPFRQYLSMLRRYWWMLVLTTALGVAYQWYATRNDLPMFRAASAVRLTDQGATMSGNLVQDYGSGFGGYTDPILTQVQV
ncbi:MAG: hypothetical protein ACREN3_05610, partial [Gemmatimonadaceae bacterium]